MRIVKDSHWDKGRSCGENEGCSRKGRADSGGEFNKALLERSEALDMIMPA